MSRSGWTLPADVVARVRRRWDDGSLLRAHALGLPFEPIEVPLRGPKPSEIGDDLGAVRAWVSEVDDGRRGDSRYSLVWRSVGGRRIGRNSLPSRAVVSTYEQAWTLLGVRAEVARFEALVALAEESPAVRSWVVAGPHRALALEGELPGLIAAHRWLDSHRGSGRHLREITAPGVDTKFVERHRGVLAAMLEVPGSASGFISALGLAGKPELVRVRPSPSLGLPGVLTEVAVRADELAALDVRPRRAVVVENEITYLSVPVPDDGIVLWGKGFEVDRVGRLPWLNDAEVTYWGDIDTHGFAILDRLRAWLPHTQSVLMDRATLLEHRERWGAEHVPAASSLTRLTTEELALYSDLVTDRLGERLRLEQERIDWAWALERLPD